MATTQITKTPLTLEEYSRMMEVKQEVRRFIGQSVNPSRLTAAVVSYLDKHIGRENRMKLLSWYFGRHLLTSKVLQPGGLTEAEAMGLVMWGGFQKEEGIEPRVRVKGESSWKPSSTFVHDVTIIQKWCGQLEMKEG